MSLQQAYANYGSSQRASNKMKKTSKLQGGLFDLAIDVGGMKDDANIQTEKEEFGFEEGIDLLKEQNYITDDSQINKNWYGKTTGVTIKDKTYGRKDLSMLKANLPETYGLDKDNLGKHVKLWSEHTGTALEKPKIKQSTKSILPNPDAQWANKTEAFKPSLNANNAASAGSISENKPANIASEQPISLYEGLDKKIGGILPGGSPFAPDLSRLNPFNKSEPEANLFKQYWQSPSGSNLRKEYDKRFKSGEIIRDNQWVLEE